MNGLNMWSLSVFILLISIWDLSVSKKICSENVLEKREEIANIVISGTVKQLMPDKIHKNMYKGEIEIKRIFKGNGEIHNRTYNVIKRGPNGRSMVMIEGFGDPHICESVVRKFDTRIFLLNKGENGDLKLNSSIVRLTLTNLERTYAAVEGKRHLYICFKFSIHLSNISPPNYPLTLKPSFLRVSYDPDGKIINIPTNTHFHPQRCSS